MKQFYPVLIILGICRLVTVSIASDNFDHVSFNFQRGLDYYKWNTTGSNLFNIRGETFRSAGDIDVMLRQPPGFPDQWRTSLKFNADWEKPVWQGRLLSGSINTDYHSDQEVEQTAPLLLNRLFPDSPDYITYVPGLTTGLDNNIFRQSADVGMDFKQVFDLNIRPSVGIYGESILNTTAVGPTGNLAVEGSGMDWGGFQSDVSANASGQLLEDRRNREINADFRAWKQYSEQSSNLFLANFRNYVREFPVADTMSVRGYTIDRRYEEEYRIGNVLNYNIFGPVGMILDMNFSRRKVVPSLSNETHSVLEISTGVTAGFTADVNDHRFDLNFTSNGQNQNYPARDVEGRQYRIDWGTNFRFAQDSLKIHGQLSRHKYDVLPEALSIDTRDELRHSYKITYYHDAGEGLETETQLRADFNHLVYLKAERSADNNWERFFLFSPEVRYLSQAWSQRAKFHVSAKYVDYDFESSAPPSRVYRKFSADDSLYISLNPLWGIKVEYLFLLEDRGDLDWKAFIQELSDEYRTNDLSLMFIHRYKGLEYGIGWAYYQRQAYHTNSNSELVPGERVESTGPAAVLYGCGPLNMQMELTASYRSIIESVKPRYSQTQIDITLIKML